MRQLSHADRAAILNIVEQLGESKGQLTDAQLIRAASDVLLNTKLHTGFEHVLARDTVSLCNYLRASEDVDVRRSARAALRYLVQRDDYWPDSSPEVGFQDDAYVLALTLNQIQRATGLSTIYDAPELTEAERREADLKLEQFLGHPLCSDIELIRHAEQFRQDVAHVATSGFLGRMCRHVGLLVSELQMPTSSEAGTWTRAALSYLASPDDIIPDSLGIVGYVDDWYVLDIVVGMLKSRTDPWLSLLKEAVNNWPFLNWLVVGENGSRVPLSEYMIANIALTMQQLQPGISRSLAGISVPVAGPVPVLAAFAAGLGVTHLAAQSSPATLAFEPGQKVLVDGKKIAVFGGFQGDGGQRKFKLIQHRMDRGTKVESAVWWPEKHLSRLRPADGKRTTRGRLIFSEFRNTAPISAVDRLFHFDAPIQFTDSARRIILVAPIGECQKITSELSVFGEKLHEVIPWGHIDSEGDVESWSHHWGSTRPVVIVAPSLDKAREYLETTESHEFSLLIVHGRGSLAHQAVSLRRLSRDDVPVCVFTRDRDHLDLELLDKAGCELFEWEPADIRELSWVKQERSVDHGPIRSFEHRIVTSAESKPELQRLELPAATNTFDLIRQLRQLGSQREDLRELQAFLAASQNLMCRLLQTIVPLAGCEELNREISNTIDELNAITYATLYLSPQERALCGQIKRAFELWRDALSEHNPKATAIADLLRDNPGLVLVCHDATAAQYAMSYWATRAGGERLSAMACPGEAEEGVMEHVVIAGWLGAGRMPTLLQPPLSEKMTLLLYDIEARWYGGFQRVIEKARRQRQSRSKREAFLGPKGKQPIVKPTPSEIADEDSTYVELASLDQMMMNYRRQYAVERAGAAGSEEPEVEAQVLWFTDGSHAFLTDSYKAKSVTHLLNGTLSKDESDKASVRLVPRGEVSVGDRLLFYRGSDGDAIRVVADQLLPPGRRRVAGLWRDALRCYRDNKGLSIMGVWRKLKEAGCTHQPLTVNHWLEDEDMIGPRDAHDHELQIIAEVTQDRELIARMQDCDEAIRDVWGAHLTASNRLAKLVLSRMACQLASRRDALMELEVSVVVAQVAEVDDTLVRVRRSLSNRLLED